MCNSFKIVAMQYEICLVDTVQVLLSRTLAKFEGYPSWLEHAVIPQQRHESSMRVCVNPLDTGHKLNVHRR